MCTYGRDETLLPAQLRFSNRGTELTLTRETLARGEGNKRCRLPGRERRVVAGGEGSLMLWGGEGFQVATPSYCTPVVQSLQLLSALTVLLAEK